MNVQDALLAVKNKGNEFALLQFSFPQPVGTFGMPRLQIFIGPYYEWSKVKEPEYIIGEGCYSLKDFVDRLPIRSKDSRYKIVVGFDALKKHLLSQYCKQIAA